MNTAGLPSPSATDAKRSERRFSLPIPFDDPDAPRVRFAGAPAHPRRPLGLAATPGDRAARLALVARTDDLEDVFHRRVGETLDDESQLSRRRAPSIGWRDRKGDTHE